MKKPLTVFTAIIFSVNVFSQAPGTVWAKRFGSTLNDVAYSVVVDAMGNVYTTGWFRGTVDFDPGAGVFNLTSAGYEDIFILKLDSSGNFAWAKQMGGTSGDAGTSLVLDRSGNIYISGYFQGAADFDPGPAIYNLTSGGSFDIFISKLDSSGNFLWAKRIGGADINGDVSFSIAVDSLGNVYTTGGFGLTVDFDPGPGTFYLTAAGNADMFISKLDSAGNFVWAKQMAGPETSIGNFIDLDPTQNYVYTTGIFNGTVDFDPGPGTFYLNSANIQGDIFISKLDSAGNFIWAKAIGGAGVDNGQSMAFDALGNVYFTGYFSGTVDFNPDTGVVNTFNLSSVGDYDIYVAKFSSSGNFIWAKSIGGIYQDISYDITLDGSGNIYTIGFFEDTVDFDPGPGTYNLVSTNKDIFISKLDPLGNFIWAKAIEGVSYPALSLTLDAAGNIFAGGGFQSATLTFDSITLMNSNSSGNYSDFFIAKFNTITPNGINNQESFLHSITLFPNPFSSTAILSLNNNFSEGTIEIKNIFGAPVQKPKHFSGSTIQLQRNNLPSGIYFYRITTDKNEILTGKFIIE